MGRKEGKGFLLRPSLASIFPFYIIIGERHRSLGGIRRNGVTHGKKDCEKGRP